ncbi:hypothetical protein GGI05_000434 [Coemansia sp. RSA 2603]|nr:hypothetical protein GGI05_000434 [Coemansia sp. RSA 2603]
MPSVLGGDLPLMPKLLLGNNEKHTQPPSQPPLLLNITRTCPCPQAYVFGISSSSEPMVWPMHAIAKPPAAMAQSLASTPS